MSFEFIKFLPFILIVCILISISWIFIQNKFSKWIGEIWQIRLSNYSRIMDVLKLIMILLLLIGVLDPRGVPQKIKGKIPDEKTIVIIDTSLSMAVEDVRPNRFEKSLLIVQHFIKKAVGHQISVVLFSDSQKKFIPFTTDIDLLVSRVGSLKDSQTLEGGSNLTLALGEAIQYLRGSEKDAYSGNILLVTDSEETYDSYKVEIPKNINLAVIGVGTSQGGRVPLRRNGSLTGYKTHSGKEVISRLDEIKIKELGANVKNFKYWIATSYTLPTDEVLDFFTKLHLESTSGGDIIVKPLMFQYWVFTAMIIYLISSLLGLRRSYIKLFVWMFILSGQVSQAESIYIDDSQSIKKQKLNIATKYISNKDSRKHAAIILEEIYDDKVLIEAEDFSYIANLGVLKFEVDKNITSGLDRLYSVFNSMNSDSQELLRKNILLALKNDKQDQSKKNEKNKENNESKENKDENDKNQQQKNKDDKNNKESNSNKDKNKKSAPDEQKNESNEKEQSKEQQYEMKKQQISKIKHKQIAPLLKQLINEDGSLQKKMLETTTKSNNADSKDW